MGKIKKISKLIIFIPILMFSFSVFQVNINSIIANEPAWGIEKGDVFTWICTGYDGPENLKNDSKCLVMKERQGYVNGTLQFEEIFIGLGERINLTVTYVYDTSNMGPHIVLNTSNRSIPTQEPPLLYVVSLEMIDYYEERYPYEFNDRGVLLAKNYTTEDYLIRLELISSTNLLESSNPSSSSTTMTTTEFSEVNTTTTTTESSEVNTTTTTNFTSLISPGFTYFISLLMIFPLIIYRRKHLMDRRSS